MNKKRCSFYNVLDIHIEKMEKKKNPHIYKFNSMPFGMNDEAQFPMN